MGALTSLWNSEKGILAVALIIGATVLAALGHMTIEQWTGFSELIFGLYVGGKTLQSGAQAIATALTPSKVTVVTTPQGSAAESVPVTPSAVA
mgnify:CR=1 FL=1